jgi:hypothetical protein
MNKIYFLFLIVFFPSCATTINYLGNSYTPTKDPDLYVSEKSIERPYKIVGKGYPRIRAFGHIPEKIQQKVLEKAKKIGADAVLVQDYYTLNTGANISSFYRSDSLGKGLITIGNSTVTNTGLSEFIVFFLKYTDH